VQDECHSNEWSPQWPPSHSAFLYPGSGSSDVVNKDKMGCFMF